MSVPVIWWKFYGLCRTGVFSWCVISWFYFPWNVNLGNYSSWSVTWSFSVAREELESWTDIHDFTTLFHVILRCKSSEWLKSSIESDLGMRFAIWSLDLAFHEFAFFHTLSSVRTGYYREYLTCLFSWFRKTKFLYSWSSIFFVPREPCHRPPLYDPLRIVGCFWDFPFPVVSFVRLCY